MKNQKGITLITLVITIVVMTIIAGVTTYSGFESIKSAQITAFTAELEMIQAKVNVIYEKRKKSDEEKEYYDKLGQNITVVNNDMLSIVLGESSKEGFRYFSKDDLKKIDLDDIKQDVIINYDTCEVISLKGIEIDGVKYYKLKDLPNYNSYEVEYVNKNTEAKEFIIEQTKLSDSYRITIKDTNGNDINSGSVSYKLHNDENWLLNGNNMSFIVSKPGIYNVKYTDTAGNSKIKENILVGTEIFKEDFDEFNYETKDIKINSNIDSVLDVTSVGKEPQIYMHNITSFNPQEHRYLEVGYKTTNNTILDFFIVKNNTDEINETNTIKLDNLVADGQWHTCILDLCSNDNIKSMQEITGWTLSWGDKVQEGASMQMDYIKVI